MIKKLIIFLFLTIQCFATDWYVDNTAPIIQTKLPKAPTGVTYTVYGDVKPTNTTSVLVEDLDILTTNVSSYVVTLTNVTVSGDTTFGEFDVPVETVAYIKVGVVAISSTGKKPSLMRVSSWWKKISARETKPLNVFVEEK